MHPPYANSREWVVFWNQIINQPSLGWIRQKHDRQHYMVVQHWCPQLSLSTTDTIILHRCTGCNSSNLCQQIPVAPQDLIIIPSRLS